MATTRDHSTAGMARLAAFLRDKPNAEAIFEALFAQCNELETALQDLAVYRQIDNAVGQFLDDIGDILGQMRNGLEDAAYRLYLKARVRVNSSSGTMEDLLELFAPLVEGASIVIVDEWPAAISITIGGVAVSADTAAQLVGFLRQAKAAGVRAILNWSVEIPEETFAFDDADLGFDDSDIALGGSDL